jgi:DNA-binding response OmpR family regulator
MQRVLLLPHTRELDALVIRLLEALDYEPALLREAEPPASAVKRLTPAAVMMDADHPATGETALSHAAQRIGAPIILFSASRSPGELRREAETHGAGSFVLPNGPRALAAVIGEALRAVGHYDADDEATRIGRWARLAAHHQERVRWHETLTAEGAVELERALEHPQVERGALEALQRAWDAAREARGELRSEVTRYVQHLKTLHLTSAELVSRVGGVVREALEDTRWGADALALEAQVEEWCMEAFKEASEAA